MISPEELKQRLDQNAAEHEHQRKFGVRFRYAEKDWGFSIWAVNKLDAELKLQALKHTAVIDGEIVETFDA
jgi:hypothetical protein